MSDNPAFLNAVADAVYKFFQNMHEDGVEVNFNELASRFLWHQMIDEYHTLDFDDAGGQMGPSEWTLTLKIRVDRYNAVWKGNFELERRVNNAWLSPLNMVIAMERTGHTSTLSAVDEMRKTFNDAVSSTTAAVVPDKVKVWVNTCLWPDGTLAKLQAIEE